MSASPVRVEAAGDPLQPGPWAVQARRLHDLGRSVVVGRGAPDDLPVDGELLARLPLYGRVIAVTRSSAQASELVSALTMLGASTLAVPTISFGDVDFTPPADLAAYAWIVFTSPNGVDRFFALGLDRQGRDARALAGCLVAAVGPGTAAALARRGIRADLVPERFVAEALLASFPPARPAETPAATPATTPASGGGSERSDPGTGGTGTLGTGTGGTGTGGSRCSAPRVLIARALAARDVLPEGLARLGYSVEVLPVYETSPARPSPDIVEALAIGDAVDAVTFTSASTVTGWCEGVAAALGGALPNPHPPVVSIGPITSAAARELGLTVAVEADPHTIPGVVAAVVGLLGPAVRMTR